MQKSAMSLLVLLLFFPLFTLGQFPVSDGINDLFAVLTQCPINPRNPPEKLV